ncbi:MAG TPA: flagellin [Bacteroidota bacterium]|nr:flagellin [Bacteroidota bacterium]
MAYSSGARINTNIGAYNALNALNNVNRELGVHQLRLATGKRVNSAQDDASGYVISKKMDARIRALTVALDNMGDAQSVLSTAESGYQTVADLLVQMKEKQTRFQNGSWSDEEKNAIVSEMEQLRQEIRETIGSTKFNNVALMDGSFANVTLSASSTLKVGDSGTSIVVTGIEVSGAKPSATYNMTYASGNVTLTNAADATDTQTVAAKAAAGQGEAQTLDFDRLGIKISLLSKGAATAAEVASELDGLGGGSDIVTSAGTNRSFEVGGNALLAINFENLTSLGLYGTEIQTTNAGTVNIDADLATVNSAIGDIGALLSRLTTKEANLNASITNTQAAQSRIVDADIAKEQIAAVKLQILQQTATAQLAQANQSPQVFLTLFR